MCKLFPSPFEQSKVDYYGFTCSDTHFRYICVSILFDTVKICFDTGTISFLCIDIFFTHSGMGIIMEKMIQIVEILLIVSSKLSVFLD